MTKEFFEEVMRIPSCSGHEDMMQEFLLSWASKHGCTAKKDSKGNILMTKGKPPTGHYYPAFINHMDTVHHDQLEMIKQKVFKEIVWDGDKVTAINPLLPKQSKTSSSNRFDFIYRKDDNKKLKQPSLFDKDDVVDVEQNADGTYEVKDTKDKSEKEPEDKKEDKKEEPIEMGRQTGLGMDDQGGCVIALAVINSLPYCKAAFVVEEEVRMQGSIAMDKHFFDDCAFVFSNDSPERNRGTHYSSGVQLYSDEFFKEHLQKICASNGLTTFNSEPYTDIIQVREHTLPDGKHLECLNFGNGGYHPHSDTEHAIFKDVCAAEKLLHELCTKIPLNKQYTSDIKAERISYSGYDSYGGYRSGGYSAWRSSQKNTSYDDDDWWNKITGKTSNKDFADKDPQSYGSFTFKFAKPDFAATALLALKRLQKTIGETSMDIEKSGSSITISGSLLAMRYAYMACFNAENQTKYANWSDFLSKVPKAKDAFEQAVSFDDDIDMEDDSKMSHSGTDNCLLNIYMDEDEYEKFEAMCKNDVLKSIASNIDIDPDGFGNCTITGTLDNVKKMWAGACSIMQEIEPPIIDFNKLQPYDQAEFWDEVEFEDDYADEEDIPQPESLDDEEDIPSDVDEFWDWYNNQDEH
jgi:hypothetical protein